MTYPTMHSYRKVAAHTYVLPSYTEVPGMGVLPVNAFLIRGTQPVLVDAGLPAVSDQFIASLTQLIDLQDLRWLYITHMDTDHVGALERLLMLAPRARLVTTFLGFGKWSMSHALPLERVYLLNAGDDLDVGDRRLRAFRPPVYDAPETTGAFDTRTGAVFTSDCFGAVLQRPAEDALDVPDAELRDGMLTWSSVDAPWLHTTNASTFEATLAELERLAPSVVLSSHLPPAGTPSPLLANLDLARTARPFVGPGQAELLAMSQPA